MPNLFVVATPIGNLNDISPRAIETLRKVDFILGEDTRVTKKLLARFKIETPLISYHQHSKIKKIEKISGLLNEGRDLALVSDAGTPGISDPGEKLIESLIFGPSKVSDLSVVPIPGPSALAAAASISGFSMAKFLFLGFPPSKNKRNKFFQELKESKYPVILYESPHRLFKTLREIPLKRKAIVCQELTKLHEAVFRGTVEEILEQLKNQPIKGEFVIVIDKPQ